MKRAHLILTVAIAMIPACSAAPDGKPGRDEITKPHAHFQAAAVQGPFKSTPTVRQQSGSTSTYRGPGNLWLNLLRGGSSKGEYPYFILRSGPNTETLDVVFFDDLGRGFFVPLQKEGASEGHYSLARSFFGGGDVGKVRDRIGISFQSGDNLVATVSSRTTRAGGVRPFGSSSDWSAVFEFQPVRMSSDLLAKAKAITGVITRQRNSASPPQP